MGGTFSRAWPIAFQPVDCPVDRGKQFRIRGAILPGFHDWRGHLQDEQEGRKCRNEAPE